MVAINFFNAEEVEPTSDWEPIPAGDYIVQIILSEFRDSKKGGNHLALDFTILEGPLAGRTFTIRLNLYHQNVQAAEIAERELSAICRAAGVLQVNDTESLHFKPMHAAVTVKPRKDDNTKLDNVFKFSPIGGTAAPANSPATSRQSTAPKPSAAPAPAAAAGASVPPWRKKSAA